MSEKLIFNGVNGATGTYGLEPMTAEALADHILASTRIEPPQAGRAVKDKEKKIGAIVRFLVESSLDEASRDTAWLDRWFDRLATMLAIEVLEQEDADPDELLRLQARLRQHSALKLEQVVKFLVEEDADDLARWLLQDQDEEQANAGELKEQLKRDARNLLNGLQRQFLTTSLAGELAGSVAAQETWLEAFITGLYLVPIQSLNALPDVSIRPLKPLTEELDNLAVSSAQPSPWLEELCQDLEEKPAAAPWPDIVGALHAGLDRRIQEQDDVVSWNNLIMMLRKWINRIRQPIDVLGVVEGIDPTNLGEAGWGIIFPYEPAPSRVPLIEEELEPLLSRRRTDAGELFKVFKGGKGYRPNDTASSFLARHGARAADPADPEKTGVPYYLLIVGSPEEIPFHFQYQLDVQYAVGRLHFDELEDYGNYARSVVAAETDDGPPLLKAAFFATANPGDVNTQNSAEKLVKPLHERIHKRYGDEWQVKPFLGEGAKKDQLLSLMGGEDTPALLFAACHGLEYSKDDAERQRKRQGALLCQEWAGPVDGTGQIPPESFVSGDDLASESSLTGMIAFFFACFGAGTPRFDEYYKLAFKERAETIADRAFVAHLPKMMLSLPKGGALAVVGHVERALGASFLDEKENEQIAVFSSAVERLLKGHPIGSAMEYFNGRYAALSTELAAEIDRTESLGLPVRPFALAGLWAMNHDARGYVIIGDPAVRLRLTGSA